MSKTLVLGTDRIRRFNTTVNDTSVYHWDETPESKDCKVGVVSGGTNNYLMRPLRNKLLTERVN